jgi:hypothetical protein
MKTQYKLISFLFLLVAYVLTACGSERKFVAPEIEPPADLIPAYVPKGYKIVSGFQISGEDSFPVDVFGDGALGGLIKGGNTFFDLKSPNGNDIQGVYYQGRDHLILIAKSYFPGGTLALWRTKYDASRFELNDCECSILRRPPKLFPSRFNEVQEELTIGKTQVIVLKGPSGWTTVFVRGDYLLTVESGISLEENLKIVSSLLNK